MFCLLCLASYNFCISFLFLWETYFRNRNLVFGVRVERTEINVCMCMWFYGIRIHIFWSWKRQRSFSPTQLCRTTNMIIPVKTATFPIFVHLVSEHLIMNRSFSFFSRYRALQIVQGVRRNGRKKTLCDELKV